MGSYTEQDFSSSIAGISDAGNLKGNNTGLVAAARRQSQAKKGPFELGVQHRFDQGILFLQNNGVTLDDSDIYAKPEAEAA